MTSGDVGADRPTPGRLSSGAASGFVVDVARIARGGSIGLLLATLACGSVEEPAAVPPVLVHADYDCRAESLDPRPGVTPGCLLDPSCERKLVVGHRGAGGNFGVYAPENSYSAIRFAILVGADAVEIDVRHTSDDQLVVMHDGSLERTTGVMKNVDTMTLAEVVEVPLLAVDFPGQFDCETVPRFDEVLAFAKGRIDLVVDTKTSRGDLVAEAIAHAGMVDQAVVSVSSVQTAVAARNQRAEIKIQLRPDTVDEYAVMQPMFDRPAEVIEIPDRVINDFLPVRDAENNRLFVNVFTQDTVVFGDGNVRAYAPPYDAGADVLQTEFPAWVLMHLGRDYWGRLPSPRDLGLDSPLLRE